MKKVDELTKNRREMERENISGHMPEDREMPEYCPVRNFETYLQKLHPPCNRLWQFPKDSFNITCSNESQYTCFIVGYGRR